MMGLHRERPPSKDDLQSERMAGWADLSFLMGATDLPAPSLIEVVAGVGSKDVAGEIFIRCFDRADAQLWSGVMGLDRYRGVWSGWHVVIGT